MDEMIKGKVAFKTTGWLWAGRKTQVLRRRFCDACQMPRTPATLEHFMLLLQSKDRSRKSGGQQYWLQAMPAWFQNHLDKEKACGVLLQTPYGMTRTSFAALHPDWKHNRKNKLIKANAQHYRVQADETHTSIGEAIRRWFGLNKKSDFEKIEVEAAFHDDDIILIPTALTMRDSGRARILEKVVCPLSFHRDYQSRLWKDQIAACRRESVNDVSWACSQIKRVVVEHQNADTKNVHEADLLRAAGALSVLGVDLGLCLTKGYDCPKSQFCFSGFPAYPCPVEIKKRSSGFNYQIMRYTDLPRAVVLCVEHDLVNPPDHVDILELSALADYLHN
jgi:hypothetical protein